MKGLICQLIAGILGLYLAKEWVSGVEVNGGIKILFLAGCFLGILNFFVAPILRFITFPLRIITLGAFTILINMAMIWLTSVFFPQIILPSLFFDKMISLFWISLIVSILNFIFSKF